MSQADVGFIYREVRKGKMTVRELLISKLETFGDIQGRGTETVKNN